MIRLIFKITHLKPLSVKPCIKFLEEIYGRFICIMLVKKKKLTSYLNSTPHFTRVSIGRILKQMLCFA